MVVIAPLVRSASMRAPTLLKQGALTRYTLPHSSFSTSSLCLQSRSTSLLPSSVFTRSTLPSSLYATTSILLFVCERCMSGGHDHHHEDSIAPGGAPGRIATNWETLTGKERDEYVANLEGKKPIDIDDEFEPTYLGTKKRPQMIKSVVDVQHVGCSGYPTGSHPHVWVSVYEEGHLYWDLGFNRCPECGMVFK